MICSAIWPFIMRSNQPSIKGSDTVRREKWTVLLLALLLCLQQLPMALAAMPEGSTASIQDLPSLFGWGGRDLFSTDYKGVLDPTTVLTFKLRPDGQPAVNRAGRQTVLQQEASAAWNEEHGMQGFRIYYTGGSLFGTLLQSGLLLTEEGSFAPAWMEAAPVKLQDVLGSAVRAAMPAGYYVASSIHTGNDGLYSFDRQWQNQALVHDMRRTGLDSFCIVDGTVYLSAGYLKPDGSFIKYGDQRFATYDYSLIGTDGKHLVFRTRDHSTMLLRTDLEGNRAQELWNTKAQQDIVFRYCSVSDGLLLVSYNRHGHFTNRKNQLGNTAEYDVKLFDIAIGRELPVQLPVGAQEDSDSLRLLCRAYWAQLHGRSILYADSPQLGRLSLYSLDTGAVRELLTADDIQLGDIDKGREPVLAVHDGWLYHLYAYDRTMLLRTALDGSAPSQFVATLEQPVQRIDAANGRVIVFSGTGSNRKYTDLTP